MKHESECQFVRDLLPLYEDGVASEESQELVRKHLKDCPDCREELRKMRTPISMPPEEDKDQWEKFIRRREKIRRGKRRAVVCTACVLAALAAFCLWYTRPARFSELCPGADGSGGMSATYLIRDVHPDGKVDSYFGGGTLERDDPAIQELLDILEIYTYHRSLLSLIPWDIGSNGGSGEAWTISKGGEGRFIMTTFSGRVELYDSERELICTVEGQEAFEKIVRRWLGEHCAGG